MMCSAEGIIEHTPGSTVIIALSSKASEVMSGGGGLGGGAGEGGGGAGGGGLGSGGLGGGGDGKVGGGDGGGGSGGGGGGEGDGGGGIGGGGLGGGALRVRTVTVPSCVPYFSSKVSLKPNSSGARTRLS